MSDDERDRESYSKGARKNKWNCGSLNKSQKNSKIVTAGEQNQGAIGKEGIGNDWGSERLGESLDSVMRHGMSRSF